MRRAPGAVAGLLGATSLLLAGCATVGPGPDPGGDPEAAPGGTFVFAAAGDPLTLDPATAADPDSLRITSQVFETLVRLAPDAAPVPTQAPTPGAPPTSTEDDPTETTAPSVPPEPTAAPRTPVAPTPEATIGPDADPTLEPGLATSWNTRDGGRSWNLAVQPDVTFHDGTPLTAAAVCTNVDRWALMAGRGTRDDVAGAYREVFGGALGEDDSRLLGCTVTGANSVRLELDQPVPTLPAHLARPQFAIQSPTAMGTHGAWVDGDTDPRTSAYATAHPSGTGPFRLGAWEPGIRVVLVRNDDYWGDPATVERALVTTVNEPHTRADQLVEGRIQAYDQVSGPEVEDLHEADDIRLQPRAMRNLTYLGLDSDAEELRDPRVRRAVSLAIDSETVVEAAMLPGSLPADGLVPDTLGEAEDPDEQQATVRPAAIPEDLGHDPAESRRLLAAAGAEDLHLRVAYPSGVSQSYLPAPEQLYVAVSDQLDAVGITAEPVAMPWNAYLEMLANPGSSSADLHVMGVRAETSDPASIVLTLLSRSPAELGRSEVESTADLDGILALPPGPSRDALVSAAARDLMEDGIVVPLAFPAEQLATSGVVQGLEAHPYDHESWRTLSVTD